MQLFCVNTQLTVYLVNYSLIKNKTQTAVIKIVSFRRAGEKDGNAGLETQRIKPLAVVSTLFDPQQSRPC